MSFDEVCIAVKDFTGSYGVKINPQTVHNKNFYHTKLSNVEIIGSFKGCIIIGTDFSGSKGAVINPEETYDQTFNGTNFADATIEKVITYAALDGANFEGSHGAVINLKTVKHFLSANLTGSKIIGYFEDCKYKYNDKTTYNGIPFKEYIKTKKEREELEEYIQIGLEIDQAFRKN